MGQEIQSRLARARREDEANILYVTTKLHEGGLLASRGAINAQKVGRDWLTTRRAVLEYVPDEQKRSKDPWKGKR